MDWFRFHTDALDNRKIQTLPAAVFKRWVNFCCLARLYGDLLPDPKTIGFRLRCSENQAETWREQLVSLRLVDKNSDGTYKMHDWEDWQSQSDDAAARKRKQREKEKERARMSQPVSRDIECDCRAVEETRVEETRVEQTERQSVTSPIPINGFFRKFLEPWPRCADQDGAARAWISVDGDQHEVDAFACRDRYLASDDVARGVVQEPKNFIFEQGRNGWSGRWPAAKGKTAKSGKSVDDLVAEIEEEERCRPH